MHGVALLRSTVIERASLAPFYPFAFTITRPGDVSLAVRNIYEH